MIRTTTIRPHNNGLIVRGMETRKHCTQEKKGGKASWVTPYYDCSVSPRKEARISRALHWTGKLSNLVQSNKSNIEKKRKKKSNNNDKKYKNNDNKRNIQKQKKKKKKKNID